MSHQYVNHPRFGSQPRFTGLDPDPNSNDVFLHWNTNILSAAAKQYIKEMFGHLEETIKTQNKAIKGTAIPANIARQTPATVQVTHYYDIERPCRDCSSPFLFFAEEQKYWYEELQFPLESDCIRCYDCRKKLQDINKIRARYQELCSVDAMSSEEEAEQAACRLLLVEEGIFHRRQLEQVRAFMNRYSSHPQVEEFWNRIKALDAKQG